MPPGHAKGRSESTGPISAVASILSGRSSSRRSSKILSDDGHSETNAPNHAASPSSLLRSPSLTASDHGSSPGKPLNRHARMKRAMAEAQNDAIGEHEVAEEEDDASRPRRPDSPRLYMAAKAKAREEEQGRTRGGTVTGHNSLGFSTDERPGEGALTLDALGGGDVVTADGLPQPGGMSSKGGGATAAGYAPVALRPNTGMIGPATPSVSPRTRPSDHLAPAAAASLLVPGERPHTRDSHTMSSSQSTSALLPEYHRRSASRPGNHRKLSDGASTSAASDGGRDSPTNSRPLQPKGGIAAAMAATSSGALGLGYQGLQAFFPDRSTSPAAAAAAAHAASPMIRNASHGQPVDKGFVGDSQGGLYRDLKSGIVVEKSSDGSGAQIKVAPTRGRSVSESSFAESDASDGLAAAAGFTAAIHGGAGHLPGPAFARDAALPAPPSIALDSSNAEQEPRGSLDAKLLQGRGSVPDTASTAGWPSDVGPQITGFAVASSKRNAEFHALFPSVSEEDYLIEDYGCALVREVFIQGRLYVSENHICFNANIFGWVTSVVIAFSEIVSIEKRMTALIIPNAIQIATLHQKHTFSSFLGRDTTYDLVANIWKLSHPDVPSSAAPTQEMEGDSSEDSDGEVGGNTASSTMRAKLKKTFKASKSTKDGETGKEVKVNGNVAVDRNETGKNGKSNATGKEKHPATTCACDTEKKHLAVVALDTVYPTTPEKLHRLLFHDDDFMKTFWTVDEKLFELQIGDWKDDPPTRSFSYIKPLSGSIGPKQTKCNITDETVHVDNEEYITMLTTTRTPEVPSGGSFSVKTRTCITWSGGGNASRVYVTCATDWTGRSMLRSVIDKASIDGQKQYYKDLDAAIKRHIKEHKQDFIEEGEDPEELDAAVDRSAEEGAKKEASGASAATSASQSQGVLAQIMDHLSTIGTTVSDVVGGALGEASPSMLILGAVVVLLLVSNIWALSSSGAGRGQSRDPLDPHRLRPRSSGGRDAVSPAGSAPSAEAVEIANAVRDVLREHLGPIQGRTSPSLLPSSPRRSWSTEECQGELGGVLAELDHMTSKLDRLKEQYLEMKDVCNISSAAQCGEQNL